jgi:hypothetical protein
MLTKVGRILTALGAIVVIVCFFLPWVHSDVVANAANLAQPMAALLKAQFGEQLQQWANINALSLVFGAGSVPTLYKALAVATLLLAILTLAWAAIAAGSAPRFARLVNAIAVLLTAAVLGLLLVYRADIAQLGITTGLAAQAITALKYQVAWAFWLTVAGLVLIVLGAVLSLAGLLRRPPRTFTY